MNEDLNSESTPSETPPTHPVTGDVKRMIKELRGNTDRSLAILTAARIDDILRSMLSLRLLVVSGKKNDDSLLGREKPLDSLSSRIKAAYRFGCIRKDLFHALDLIRSIRNDFAHKDIVLSFDDKVISSRIQTLRTQCGPNPAIDDVVSDFNSEGFSNNTSLFLGCVCNGVLPGLRTCEANIVRVQEATYGLLLSESDHDDLAMLIRLHKARKVMEKDQ